uniref:Uncharacterized protein n=1 Tax=Oryza glumipatula TaxID=40148 RepID=A0A0E0BDA3_9ORYZ
MEQQVKVVARSNSFSIYSLCVRVRSPAHQSWATQRELDSVKAQREDLVKAQVTNLRVLFPSRGEGKDPFMMAGCRRMAESAARIATNHALAMVKSHYPWVDMAAVEEGYAADYSEEDVGWRLEEVAYAAAALNMWGNVWQRLKLVNTLAFKFAVSPADALMLQVRKALPPKCLGISPGFEMCARHGGRRLQVSCVAIQRETRTVKPMKPRSSVNS